MTAFLMIMNEYNPLLVTKEHNYPERAGKDPHFLFYDDFDVFSLVSNF